MQIHGSCASRAGDGVLLIGPPGAGKSDLLLRLLARGFDLVADDRVDIDDGIARPAPSWPDCWRCAASVSCGCHMSARPGWRWSWSLATTPLDCRSRRGIPRSTCRLVRLDPWAASAPERVALALDCALGRVAQVAGAFAA